MADVLKSEAAQDKTGEFEEPESKGSSDTSGVTGIPGRISRFGPILKVLLLEFILPMAAALGLILLAFVWQESAPDTYVIGTTSLHFLKGDVFTIAQEKNAEAVVTSANNALEAVSADAFALNSAVHRNAWSNFGPVPITVSKETPVAKEIEKSGSSRPRVRLGETVFEGKLRQGTNDVALFRAALYLHDFIILEKALPQTRGERGAWFHLIPPAQAAQPQKEPPVQQIVQPPVNATQAPAMPSNLSIQAAPNRQQTQPPLNAQDSSMQQKVESPNIQQAPRQTKEPYVEVPIPIQERDQQPPTTGKRTSSRIVQSATMAALLQTEARGIGSLALMTLGTGYGGLTEPESAGAILDGLGRVEGSLASLRDVYLVFPVSTTMVKEKFAPAFPARAWRYVGKAISVPLQWPGGPAFFQPHVFEWKEEGLKDPAYVQSLFNPAFAVTGRVTFLPTFLFLFFGFLALLLNLLRLPATQIRPTRRGFLGGCMLILVMGILLFALSRVWKTFPGIWLETLPGLATAGLLIGSAAGLALCAFRNKSIVDQPEQDPDNLLRSVLYPDKPIDDISRDRLGFVPLVNALRRFLDNRDTEPPVVISVNGPWGSGKSSVMKMLVSELKKTGRFRSVWFNAWRYHKEEQILAAFLQTVAQDLSRGWPLPFAFRLGWARFKGFSYTRHLAFFALLAAVVGGVFHPEIFDKVAKMLSSPTPEMVSKTTEYQWVVNTSWGALSVGWAVWLYKMSKPFRLQFKKLYEVEDQSKRVGFIEDFSREFKLFREAVGEKKFLIVIDDLDRCPPDKVIEVLKTINLIISSGEGAGRSFFVLGYDQKYILNSIEHHFKEVAKLPVDRGFAQEYLKKMVNLSVSVPQTTPDGVAVLLEDIDQCRVKAAERKKRRGLSEDARKRLRGAAPAFSRMTAAAATVVLITATFYWLIPPIGNREAPKPLSQTDSTIIPVQGASIVMPEISAPTPDTPPFWLWGMVGLVFLSSAGMTIVLSRPPRVEEKYRREPKDSDAFKNAIEKVKRLLPGNPRDVVRLINQMRLVYLIQSSAKGSDESPQLRAWECVSYSILQQRHPGFFNPKYIEEKVIPAIKDSAGKDSEDKQLMKTDPETLFNKLLDQVEMITDVGILKKGGGGTMEHVADVEKLKRFVGVNRYVFDSGE